MAQKVVSYVLITDDLTGEELPEGDAETITYSIDGNTYEIDLSRENAKEFRDAVSRYVGVSRKTMDTRGRTLSTGGGGPRPGKRRSGAEMQRIREWGKANGYDVPEPGKGRTPWGMTQAYDRAMAGAR